MLRETTARIEFERDGFLRPRDGLAAATLFLSGSKVDLQSVRLPVVPLMPAGESLDQRLPRFSLPCLTSAQLERTEVVWSTGQFGRDRLDGDGYKQSLCCAVRPEYGPSVAC